MALAKELRYLFFAHGINVAIPLLLIPLLAHRLGVEAFGRFVILTGSSVYLAYAIELGLNNVAIERFSRSTQEEKRAVFTGILIIKCVLLAIVIPIGMTLYSGLLQEWGWEISTGWFCMLPVATCLSYPAWFFIVEKKQKVNFYVQMVTKFLLLVGICAFVHGPNDAPVAVIVYSSATCVASIVFCKHWLPYVDTKAIPAMRYLIEFASAGAKASGLAVRDAWSANGITPLLGVILHTQQVADFALAEKMIRALAIPASSFGSIILANHFRFRTFYKSKAAAYLSAILIGALAVYALVFIGVILGAQHYLPQYQKIALLFMVMLASVPFIYANYTLLNLTYIQRQKYKELTISIVMQAVCAFTLVAWFAQSGHWLLAAGSVVVVEIVAFGCVAFVSCRADAPAPPVLMPTDR